MTRIGKKNWNGPQQTRNTPEWIEWARMVQQLDRNKTACTDLLFGILVYPVRFSLFQL